MAEPFLGEIKVVAFKFAPRHWAFCDGQALPVNQNEALFSLIGNTYGAAPSGQFFLPDLRGRMPVGMGTTSDRLTYPLGARGGAESVSLTAENNPLHFHRVAANGTVSSSDSTDPEAMVWGKVSTPRYAPEAGYNLQPMMSQAVGDAGHSLPHENMMPFLPLNFVICLQGLYPIPVGE